VLHVRVLADAETSPVVLGRVRLLVDAAFAGEFSMQDWQHTMGGWRVLVFDAETLVAHAAVVPRLLVVAQRAFQAGYVEGVATLPDQRRQGFGSLAMARVTSLVRATFEMGGLSTGLPGFYQRFGWELWRGPSFVQTGRELIRTPDEDDGVMVLRFGPSTHIDLTAPITCQSRSGDAW
jgi:aminoglycoside 2'-N-acetyltransferase I